MRNVRKFGIYFLCLFLIMLTACSSTSNSSNSKESGNSSKDVLEIGAIVPLTGSGASYGEMYKQGIELAVEEINANGGVDGKQLSVLYEDGRADPKASVQAAQTLVSKDVPIIVTGYTGVVLAIMPTAERNNIMVINGAGQGDGLAGASPYLFNTIPLLRLEVKTLAKYLNEEKSDLKKGYIVYVDDESGRTGLNKFSEEFKSLGGEIVGSGSHTMGETNFRNILIQAKSKNPDFIYVASHGQDAKLIIDQTRELGLDVPIVSTSWTIAPEIINNPNAQGIIHTSIAFNPDEEFLEKFKEKYESVQVTNYVSNYYDAVKIFAKAYEYAVEKGYTTDGEGISKAIHEIKEFESANGKVTFQEDGTSVRQIDISKIEDKESRVIKSY